MSELEITRIIQTAKDINLEEITATNEYVSTIIKNIIEFVQQIEDKNPDLITELINSNVRFCDYYDSSMFHGYEIINYFDNTYIGDDKESLRDAFSLYVMLKNAQDLIYNFELCESLDELYELLDNNNYFEDIIYMIDYIKERELLYEDEQQELDFLNDNNKYKIFFTGFAYKDITKLQKNVKKALISKLSSQLSKSDVVTLSEAIDHVKELYNFPLFRVQFANDYRIAYIRRNNVTAILGVTIKSGKDIDYTRYDSIAKNSSKVYEEIDDFINGELSKDSEHFKVIEHLETFQRKLI